MSIRLHGLKHCGTWVHWNADMKKQKAEEQNQADPGNIQAQAFSFRELATATKNFRQECLLDEGGFGRIYRGIIPATGQVISLLFYFLKNLSM